MAWAQRAWAIRGIRRNCGDHSGCLEHFRDRSYIGSTLARDWLTHAAFFLVTGLFRSTSPTFRSIDGWPPDSDGRLATGPAYCLLADGRVWATAGLMGLGNCWVRGVDDAAALSTEAGFLTWIPAREIRFFAPSRGGRCSCENALYC